MFGPFSFEGRIRRTEYGISAIIYFFLLIILNSMIEASDGEAAILRLAYIPLLWFFWAQGAKRCHDLGNSGWWQVIPFYGLWLLFQDGQRYPNVYVDNPKGINVIRILLNTILQKQVYQAKNLEKSLLQKVMQSLQPLWKYRMRATVIFRI